MSERIGDLPLDPPDDDEEEQNDNEAYEKGDLERTEEWPDCGQYYTPEKKED
ncbi:MAG TPA: hypothetical protein VIM16_00770 [Mucilaginibacter sp.]|jgi:hypothetical protein